MEGEIITKQTSSFTLKQTAKGEYYWEIKVYCDDIEEMKKKVVNLNDWAIETYGSMIK